MARFTALGCLALLTVACEGEPRELELEVGFLHEGEYRPMEPGGECPVVEAPQGGFWLMPTVRAWGAPSDASVGCALYDFDLDLELGRGEQQGVLTKGEGDFKEAAPFAFYLAEVDRELFPELEGHQGELDCFVRTKKLEEHAVFDVQLAIRSLL